VLRETPRFSLILPCLSDAATLAVTLDGIADQDFDLSRIQVIVVDDGSEPPLGETVRKFCERSPADVLYIRNPNNLGRAASRNRGIAAAFGEILVFMDVDQLLDPEFLTEMDREFGGDLEQSVRANTAVWPPLLEKSAFLRYYDTRFLGKRSQEEIARINLNDLLPRYYATTCIATGRAAVQRAGAFDEQFRQYGCEDEELGVRLHKAGVLLRLSLRAKSFSTDDALTVRRACRRLIDYAGHSVPPLLKKHPEYRAQMTLGALESGQGPDGMARKLLLTTFRLAFAEALLKYLERHDGREGFRPPEQFYQVAMLGFYLQGIRQRPAERK